MLIEEHARLTGSKRAHALLADWSAGVAGFRQIVPVARVKSEPLSAEVGEDEQAITRI
jgi:glutamate synthase domain-containing protein 3